MLGGKATLEMMPTLLMGAIAIGIAFHLVGLGDAFTHLATGILAIMWVVGGILAIFKKKVLGPLLGVTFTLGFVPPFIAGIAHQMSWVATILLVIGILVAAFIIAGRKR